MLYITKFIVNAADIYESQEMLEVVFETKAQQREMDFYIDYLLFERDDGEELRVYHNYYVDTTTPPEVGRIWPEYPDDTPWIEFNTEDPKSFFLHVLLDNPAVFIPPVPILIEDGEEKLFEGFPPIPPEFLR